MIDNLKQIFSFLDSIEDIFDQLEVYIQDDEVTLKLP